MAAATQRTTSRRVLLQLAPAALLYALGSRRALAQPLRAEIFTGLQRMSELSAELRDGAITTVAWQDQMAQLTASLDVAEVIAAVDPTRVLDEPLPDDRARVRELRLSPLREALQRAGLHLRLFGLGSGRAIVPHGHHDMVSMHWLLHGAMHGRHYDRLGHTREHMRLRPTIDRVLRAGDATSISEQRDNVHWFTAIEGPAVSLGIIAPRLTGQEVHGRVYVDPRRAEPEGGDVLRAPIISPREARRRYGRG